MHGKTSVVRKTANCPIFDGIPDEFEVARYHSLAADEKTLPECLEVTALTTEGEIMAVQHKEYPIYGLQFHPESILTPEGKTMIQNFLKEAKHHD
jgi:anthranilate synthase component 2